MRSIKRYDDFESANFFLKLDPVTETSFATAIPFIDPDTSEPFTSTALMFACKGGDIEISFDGTNVAWEILAGEIFAFDNRRQRRFYVRKTADTPVLRAGAWK